jgi:hypothetical protein
MTDDSAADRGRKTLESTVRIGSGPRSVPGEMNFISGEVDIEVSGHADEGDDVLALVEQIETAVEVAVRDFEATEYDDAND